MKPLASSTALGLSVFLQCTSSVIWWFNLFPIKVFQEKILMCFIEKMVNLALFAGVTKSDFADLSTSEIKKVSGCFLSKSLETFD